MNSWRCHKTVKPGVNLWSRVLIYNRPTRERDADNVQYTDAAMNIRPKAGLTPSRLFLLLLQELVEDVAVATSSRHADLSWARRFAVASPRFIGRRSASTTISVQHIRCKHELQQELYWYYYHIVTSGATCRLCNYNRDSGHTKTHPSVY